ncbi:MAG: TadE/TadG family type IV pilus assembly protein [Roseiarcus sp.]
MGSLRKIIGAGLRAAREFARREDGGPASEFVLVAPIIIVLIVGTAQIGVIYLANAYLETAAEDAARMVLTNNAVVTTTTGTTTTTTPMTAAQFQSAVCGNIGALFTCSNIMVSLAPATSTTSISTAAPAFNANGTLANTLPYTLPTPGQIAVLQVLYQWPVVGLPLGFNFANLGNGTHLMMSTQVFMVEAQ